MSVQTRKVDHNRLSGPGFTLIGQERLWGNNYIACRNMVAIARLPCDWAKLRALTPR